MTPPRPPADLVSAFWVWCLLALSAYLAWRIVASL